MYGIEKQGHSSDEMRKRIIDYYMRLPYRLELRADPSEDGYVAFFSGASGMFDFWGYRGRSNCQF